jgi:hypothetical protein
VLLKDAPFLAYKGSCDFLKEGMDENKINSKSIITMENESILNAIHSIIAV